MVSFRRRVVGWVLVVTMVASPSWVYAQQGLVTSPALPASKLDLSYVTPGAAFAVVAHPRRVLMSPGMEMLPIEVISRGR